MVPLKLLITIPALKAIDIFLSKRNKRKVLRVGVKGGGSCCGFKYIIECADEFSPSKDFYFIYDKGLYVVVDRKSMVIMNGAILHWVETRKEKGLKFFNPNSKSTCSCGKSFSV